MPALSKQAVRRSGSATLAAALLCLVMACTARAADSIYWVNFFGNTISHANLAGGGGGEVPIASPFVNSMIGLGIDSTRGTLYWSNIDPDTIGTANLDGSGAGQLNVTGANLDNPIGPAIDAAAGRIYWANSSETTPTISFANLSGGGGGALDTTGVAVIDPELVVVHPAAGKVYWAGNEGIAFANLGGGGGGLLIPANANGLAIDASSNKLYWIERNTDTIHFTSLNGGPGGVLDTSGATVRNPAGLAIDPAAGRIYWANFGTESPRPGDDTIGFASLKGGGGGQLDTTGATLNAPANPVLLKTPLATAPPILKGRHRAGSRLTCESSWAGDLPESFLYRAPQTVAYQWLRNGRPIAGAITQGVKANKVGRYACQAIGTNFAGSTSSTASATANVKAALKLGKIRLNPVAGTATLKVAAFGAGRLTIKGAGIRRQSAKASPKARLSIAPTRRLKERLEDAGRARVKVKVTLAPNGGKRIQRSKTIVLRAR